MVFLLFKKSYREIINVDEIAMIKQNRFQKSGFYLQLKNGKQRDLTEVRHINIALDLLLLLREENNEIIANFREQRVQ